MDFLYESGLFWVYVAYKVRLIAQFVCYASFLLGIVRLLVTFICCVEKSHQFSEAVVMTIGKTRRFTICCSCVIFLGAFISAVTPSFNELKEVAIYTIGSKAADSLKETELFQTLLNQPDHNKKSK